MLDGGDGDGVCALIRSTNKERPNSTRNVSTACLLSFYVFLVIRVDKKYM